MSSGTLPLATYYKANALGAGAYGSVVTVYDDDGNEFALKLFYDEDENSDEEDSEEEEEEDSECESESEEEYEEEEESGHEEEVSDEDEDEEEECDKKPMDLGALREISILRLLRHENSHPNVIAISDVKQPSDFTCFEDEDEHGYVNTDASMNCPGITMKLFHNGTLTQAIESTLTKKVKVQIAHGLLSAMAFLHTNGIIHRDIKADNVMIEILDDGTYKAVLIDFSLAKIIVPSYIYGGTDDNDNDAEDSAGFIRCDAKRLMESPEWQAYFPVASQSQLSGEDTHTPSIGTPTYRAPECVNNQPYGLPSDMYSVGVALLELLRGKCIESFKDKGAAVIVENALQELPDQPFANLVRGLLEHDPAARLTAKTALDYGKDSGLFAKFGIYTSCIDSYNADTLNINHALPLYDEDENDENEPTSGGANHNNTHQGRQCNTKCKGSTSIKNKRVKKRMECIAKIAHDLESENPLTIQAAYSYSTQLSQLDDSLDDLSQSQGLVDCVVLAHKFFEKKLWDLGAIEALDRGIFKQMEWSLQEYVDNEATIWMLMDFCLYPRKFVTCL